MSRLLPVCLIIMVLLSLTGCGSSKPSGKITIDGQATTLKASKISKEAYVKKINIRCTSMQQQIMTETNKEIALYAGARNSKTSVPELTDGQQAQLVELATVPVAQRWLDLLVAVRVPTADLGRLAEFYQTYQDALTKLKKKPALLLKTNVFADADQQANDYGLYPCEIR